MPDIRPPMPGRRLTGNAARKWLVARAPLRRVWSGPAGLKCIGCGARIPAGEVCYQTFLRWLGTVWICQHDAISISLWRGLGTAAFIPPVPLTHVVYPCS